MSLKIVITDAGRAEIVNAENNGTAPVTIAEIGFGSGQYAASAAQTVLQNEFKRLSTISGAAVGDDTIHVTARDESADAYQVYEFGLYLASGTLFAVYSQNTSIIDKTNVSIALLAVDVVLQSINPASVTFGDANFINPPATTTTEGVVELATNDEVQAGTDSTRVVTPSSLSSRVATTSRTGLVELATSAETQAGTDSGRAVTPAGLNSRTATTERTGIVELATNSETQAGTDTSKAVTPAGLSSRTASTEVKGLIEIATPAEASEMTDNTRAMTPLTVKDSMQVFGLSSIVPPSLTDIDLRNGNGLFRSIGPSTAGTFPAGASEFGGLFEFGYDSSNYTQAYSPVTGDDIFVRKVISGTINPFTKLATEQNFFSLMSLHSATTTQKGIVELATNAETQTGTDSTRAVTPAGVKSVFDNYSPPNASTAQRGIIEIATNAEAQAGTDTSRAVTPAGVKAAIDSNAPSDASTSQKGIVELATNTEAQAGTDTSRAVTPSGVKAAIDNSAPSDASTSQKGLVELATNAETEAGTDATRAITPQSLLARTAWHDRIGLVRLANFSEAIDAANNHSIALTPAGLNAYANDRNLYAEDNNEMVGSVAYFITTVAPEGWIKANGAAVSRTTYAKLFAKVGTFWGNGNGSTTFNLPDLRGEFIRCWDDGRGVDSGRSFGTFQADELKSHRHTLPSDSNDDTGNGWVGDSNGSGTKRTAYTGFEGGSETRPRNVALVAYIKY